jgi:uncharacterized protein YcbK (DUF882 family)
MTETLRRPSPHLTWTEVACRDGTPYPKEWTASRLLPLAREFEAIRRLCGHQPIRVLSAYRTPQHNARVGGARRSMHMEGRALDLAPPAGLTVEQFAQVVTARAQHPRSLIRGIGVYPTFVHVDTRPGPRHVRWRGTRAAAEVDRR